MQTTLFRINSIAAVAVLAAFLPDKAGATRWSPWIADPFVWIKNIITALVNPNADNLPLGGAFLTSPYVPSKTGVRVLLVGKAVPYQDNHAIELFEGVTDDELDWHLRIKFTEDYSKRFYGIAAYEFQALLALPDPTIYGEWMVLYSYSKPAISDDKFYSIPEMLDFLGISNTQKALDDLLGVTDKDGSSSWDSTLMGREVWVQGFLVNDEGHDPRPELHPLLSIAYRDDESNESVNTWKVGYFGNSSLHNVCSKGENPENYCGEQTIRWALPLPGNKPLEPGEYLTVKKIGFFKSAETPAGYPESFEKKLYSQEVNGKTVVSAVGLGAKIPESTKIGSALIETWQVKRGKTKVDIECASKVPSCLTDLGIRKKGNGSPDSWAKCAPCASGDKKCLEANGASCRRLYRFDAKVGGEELGADTTNAVYQWRVDGKLVKGEKGAAGKTFTTHFEIPYEPDSKKRASLYKRVVTLDVALGVSGAKATASDKLDVSLPRPSVASSVNLSVKYEKAEPALTYAFTVTSESAGFVGKKTHFKWLIKDGKKNKKPNATTNNAAVFYVKLTPKNGSEFASGYVIVTMGTDEYGVEYEVSENSVSLPRFAVRAIAKPKEGSEMLTGIGKNAWTPGQQWTYEYPKTWRLESYAVIASAFTDSKLECDGSTALSRAPKKPASKKPAVKLPQAFGGVKKKPTLFAAKPSAGLYGNKLFCPVTFSLAASKSGYSLMKVATGVWEFSLPPDLKLNDCGTFTFKAKNVFNQSAEAQVELCGGLTKEDAIGLATQANKIVQALLNLTKTLMKTPAGGPSPLPPNPLGDPLIRSLLIERARLDRLARHFERLSVVGTGDLKAMNTAFSSTAKTMEAMKNSTSTHAPRFGLTAAAMTSLIKASNFNTILKAATIGAKSSYLLKPGEKLYPGGMKPDLKP